MDPNGKMGISYNTTIVKKTILKGPRVGLSFSNLTYVKKNYRYLTNVTANDKYH